MEFPHLLLLFVLSLRASGAHSVHVKPPNLSFENGSNLSPQFKYGPPPRCPGNATVCTFDDLKDFSKENALATRYLFQVRKLKMLIFNKTKKKKLPVRWLVFERCRRGHGHAISWKTSENLTALVMQISKQVKAINESIACSSYLTIVVTIQPDHTEVSFEDSYDYSSNPNLAERPTRCCSP